MEQTLEKILSQPFSYLTEGLQAFVYISNNGKYILKTPKNLEQSKDQFMKWGLNPDDINDGFIKNTERSYKFAFERFKKETALIYVHMANESLTIRKITIDNKEHDPSELQFILQEKVELVKNRITKLMGSNDVKGAKKVIDDIVDFITHIWKENFTEDTFNWDHNYGYTLSGSLVQIDAGSFFEGKKYIQEEIIAKKLLDSVSVRWLNKNYPELVDYYQQKVKKLYGEFDYLNDIV